MPLSEAATDRGHLVNELDHQTVAVFRTLACAALEPSGAKCSNLTISSRSALDDRVNTGSSKCLPRDCSLVARSWIS